MTEKFFVEIVLALIACLVGLLAFIWNGHLKQHAEIAAILRQLLEIKPICHATFVRKDDMAQLVGRRSAFCKPQTDKDGDAL